LYSDYPNTDSYYRLRRYRGNSFHLAPHGDAQGPGCRGSSDTGILPDAHAWYRFRIQAIPQGDATRLRAKVWREGEGEPAWQVDCLDAQPLAFRSGRPGLWGMGPGKKLWDDLEVRRLLPVGER
jgi:hypothetical protein